MIARFKSLQNNQGFMKYFKNTSWLFGEKILRMVVGLFVGIWVARYLGPEQFGLLSYASAFVGLFTVFATLGLDKIVIKKLLEDETKRDVLLGTSFFLKIIGATIILVTIALVIQFTNNDQFMNKVIFIIAFGPVLQSLNVIDFYFQSKVLSKYIVYANIITLFSSSIVKILLIVNDAPVIAFAWAMLFDTIISVLGYLYFYHLKHLSFRTWQFDTELAKHLLKESWPMIFSGLAVAFYMKLDQIMVKELLDVKSVGYYSVAVRLSEVWIFITMVITSSLFPAIINAKKVNEKMYYKRLQKLYQFLVLIAFIISIITTLIANELINITFGEEYSPSVNILVVYIWSNIFVFLNNASWNWHISENLQHLAIVRLLVGVVSNVLLNIILINLYGLIGAAIATLVSYSIASYLGNLFFKKTRINFKMQTYAIINIFNIRSYLR